MTLLAEWFWVSDYGTKEAALKACRAKKTELQKEGFKIRYKFFDMGDVARDAGYRLENVTALEER